LILESDQFKKLISLKIKQKILSEGITHDTEDYTLNKVLLTKNKLETFEYSPISSCDILYHIDENLSSILNLRSLTLTVNTFQNILDILQFTPNLKYLNLVLQSFDMTY